MCARIKCQCRSRNLPPAAEEFMRSEREIEAELEQREAALRERHAGA
jgi:hypothetical protein